MPLRLRTVLSAAAVSGRLLRRAFSTTATARPQWAMMVGASPVKSPALGATFHLAEPPRASHLLVPAHLIRPGPLPSLDSEVTGMLGGDVKAASPDGFLLLCFVDVRTAAPVVFETHDTERFRNVTVTAAPLVTRFVCSPLNGELFRLPDVDGTTKAITGLYLGLLTKAPRGHGPPDKYAITEIEEEKEPSRCFLMRRFLSETGEWEKFTGLPSPLPLARWMEVDHEPVAFDGRLWWVDVGWGAVSVDPFSDRPDLHFVELPEGMPGEEYAAPGPELRFQLPEDMPGKDYVTSGLERRILCRYRRVGVSEGRLRYAEVSQREPFLRSFAFDGGRWTLEHEVALSPLWANGGYPWLPMGDGPEGTPRIGVIDPMNASIMDLTIGNYAVTVDMDRGKVLASAPVSPVHHGLITCCYSFFQPCLLPPSLGSSLIPRAGKRDNAKNKTLADVLIRSK